MGSDRGGADGARVGRRRPARLEEVRVFELDPERFRTVVDVDAWASFQHTIGHGRELFANRTLWNVNSTALGGGVAEMLRSLVGYARGAGLDARWVVIGGDPDFFRVTKRIHNRCTDSPGTAGRSGTASAPSTSVAASATRSS